MLFPDGYGGERTDSQLEAHECTPVEPAISSPVVDQQLPPPQPTSGADAGPASIEAVVDVEAEERRRLRKRRRLTLRPVMEDRPMLDKTYVPALSHARFKMSAVEMRTQLVQVRLPNLGISTDPHAVCALSNGC